MGDIKKEILIAVLIMLLLIAIASLIYLFNNSFRSNDQLIITKNNKRLEMANPIVKVDDKEALSSFNNSYVFFWLYRMKADSLHPSISDQDPPRIEIFIEGINYTASIINEYIVLSEIKKSNPDILIETTKDEIIKMLRKQGYVSESFISKKSNITLYSEIPTLASKGYNQFIAELTKERLFN